MREAEKSFRPVVYLLVVGFALFVLAGSANRAEGADGASWEDEWATAEGIRLERIAVGLELPTAVAIADTPDGVRYVVTELHGAIETVDSTGEIHSFARVLEEDTSGGELEETGLAGVCLDPDGQYLFVTFGERDANGILRNSIRRFDLGPDGVAGPPVGEKDISGNLAEFRSAQSHQIGGCVARDGQLFVSVGDGWNVAASGNPDALLGKVLRVDYDGAPAMGNPLGDDPQENRSYVWAYGFRNPWGISMVGEDIFVAHNGSQVDALVRVVPGADHQWSGSDETISLNALNVWVPAIGPTQLAFAEVGNQSLGTDWSGGFFTGTSTDFDNGVLFVPYDSEAGRVTGPSTWAVRHIDGPHEAGAEAREQIVAGLAVDDDGLVFAGLLPDSNGESSLYRLTFDPENQLPNRIGEDSGDVETLDEFGCLACHQFEGQGGTLAPALDQVQLEERLETFINSAEYEASLAALDDLEEEPWVDFRDARAELLAAEGKDRLPIWVKYRVMEPRFDRLESEMPTLGISEADAEHIADILTADELPWWRQQAIAVFGSRESAMWFGVGALVSAGVLALLVLAIWIIRRRRTSGAREGV